MLDPVHMVADSIALRGDRYAGMWRLNDLHKRVRRQLHQHRRHLLQGHDLFHRAAADRLGR